MLYFILLWTLLIWQKTMVSASKSLYHLIKEAISIKYMYKQHIQSLILERGLLLALLGLLTFVGVCTRVAIGEAISASRITSANSPLFPDHFSNVFGCFLMGLIAAFKQEDFFKRYLPQTRQWESCTQTSLLLTHIRHSWLYVGITTGLCGSITTFSSWSNSAAVLLADHEVHSLSLSLSLSLLSWLTNCCGKHFELMATMPLAYHTSLCSLLSLLFTLLLPAGDELGCGQPGWDCSALISLYTWIACLKVGNFRMVPRSGTQPQ